ncbi:hypothetical protein BK120_23285 [Paenibacillus sp. FSL A5-0031]|uniref:hypothetical protein n=1 Tax=Paenibacillus sp. FSL A5-0031 TaxID=1920420 RepID=UPI00096E336B|nr:hypothetical protein [Paenibacillus sp. FSL A5-0031]OME78665.1 hypothetical protein BK120_23285 [Paenibacillus sp. FSL A5-0031]
MRFKYELTGRGWASGFIEMNSNTFYFATSYITDALDEMLKALILLNPELSPFPVSNSQFEWNEEPGGTVWKFRKIDDLLHVQIMSFENLRNKKQLVIELNESCSILEFSEAVVQALDLLLSLHGKEGYKEKWVNYDFPTNNYLKLKGFVTKKN